MTIFVLSLRCRAAFPRSCLHGVGTRATYIPGQIFIFAALCVGFHRRVKREKMKYKTPAYVNRTLTLPLPYLYLNLTLTLP